METQVVSGRQVTLPCEVRDARAVNALFTVDLAAARRLVAPPGLEVLPVLRRRALLSMTMVDYTDNDLGSYNELSIAFVVRPPGDLRAATYGQLLQGNLATWIHRLPVDEEFSCAAGQEIWGFPKTVDEVDIVHEARSSRCTWTAHGREVLTLSLPTGGKRTLPPSTLRTFTTIEGRLHETSFEASAEGAGVHVRAGSLKLGQSALADELRALGLRRRPLVVVSMQHMRGTFAAPVPV